MLFFGTLSSIYTPKSHTTHFLSFSLPLLPSHLSPSLSLQRLFIPSSLILLVTGFSHFSLFFLNVPLLLRPITPPLPLLFSPLSPIPTSLLSKSHPAPPFLASFVTLPLHPSFTLVSPSSPKLTPQIPSYILSVSSLMHPSFTTFTLPFSFPCSP